MTVPGILGRELSSRVTALVLINNSKKLMNDGDSTRLGLLIFLIETHLNRLIGAAKLCQAECFESKGREAFYFLHGLLTSTEF